MRPSTTTDADFDVIIRFLALGAFANYRAFFARLACAHTVFTQFAKASMVLFPKKASKRRRRKPVHNPEAANTSAATAVVTATASATSAVPRQKRYIRIKKRRKKTNGGEEERSTWIGPILPLWKIKKQQEQMSTWSESESQRRRNDVPVFAQTGHS